MIAHTSYESLKKLEAEGKLLSQARRILLFLFETGRPVSRNFIERYFALETPVIRLSSVCGRVNELIEKGYVRVSGMIYDLNTERNVELVEVVGQTQLEMF